MLREIEKTRQIPGESLRRWFHSPDMDLIVWLNGEASAGAADITGFQLCYDKNRNEKALCWKADHGFSHMRVDDGEAAAGKHKGTPLFAPDRLFNSNAIQQCFSSAGQALPVDIRCFIEAKLAQASLSTDTSSPGPQKSC